MNTIRQIPMPLRFVVIAIVLLVIIMLLLTIASASGRSSYDFMRDVVIPLVGPMVAILVPTVLLYLIPLAQNQQKSALDLFNIYSAEDMRQSRNEAWKYLVIERRDLSDADQIERLDDYLRHLTAPAGADVSTPETHEIYQKISKVLDFFAIMDACARRGSVDRGMLRSFLAFYYLWWCDEIMDPLRRRPLPFPIARKPMWWEPLAALDELCRREA